MPSHARRSARVQGRRVAQRHYVPQPPDFPVTRDEPAYLKTVWLPVAGAGAGEKR